MESYLVPLERARTETIVGNSRFITTVVPAGTVEQARAALHDIRTEMPDASHHVYAYHIGHGNSVIDGMSDDGEPSGTSGPPVLAVLRGSGLGDILVVVTRYFGGTKLGTGGLVRAYSDAARAGLDIVTTELKIEKRPLVIPVPSPLYDQVKRLVGERRGEIEDRTFAEDVLIIARFPADEVAGLQQALGDLSAGRVSDIDFDA
jgi:uncharacterized YigZ family protein